MSKRGKRDMDIRPWRHYKYVGQIPNDDTRRKWRVKARALAKSKGFYTSCDLCKRPIAREHRFGEVGLRPGTAWRSRQKRRQICHGCYIVLDSLIEELEALGARDHLPPEDYADYTEEERIEREKADEETRLATNKRQRAAAGYSEEEYLARKPEGN